MSTSLIQSSYIASQIVIDVNLVLHWSSCKSLFTELGIQYLLAHCLDVGAMNLKI